MNRNRSLIIPSARKGDCGTYTCIAINPVSFTQADYTLTIYGISPEQIIIVAASIIGLMFSTGAFLGIMVLCWLKGETRQASVMNVRRWFLILLISNILSLVAIVIALISWIAIKGASFVAVVALIVGVILLVLALTATIATWNLGCLCIKEFLKRSGFRVSLDASSLICSLTVIVISIPTLAEEIQQNNQGCSVTFLTWTILVPILVTCVIFPTVISAIWCCRNEDRNEDNNQNVQQADEEL
ncbi:uncharacterized protein LOC121291884 [Carcharodon carcharias]|uniref:uncharacterized protein LOC121291884 n=1 Tax=Carcharodon carcharias TaxID=13397 RepID=UPI001B7E30A2|nr:uncharacterized protein LOC121291884 [Carcharodon carcharias]